MVGAHLEAVDPERSRRTPRPWRLGSRFGSPGERGGDAETRVVLESELK